CACAPLHSFPTRRSSDLPPAPATAPRFLQPHAHALTGKDVRDIRSFALPIAKPIPQPRQALNLQIHIVRWFHAGSLYGCERFVRSEEHTSELQSRENLVC